MTMVARWDYFEWTLPYQPQEHQNPFTQIRLQALVTGPDGTACADGFYDGDGLFRIRFMPQAIGVYTLTTSSNVPALHQQETSFECVPASGDNHGPVNPDGMHFRYADGERCFIMGTTAYAWHYRPDEVCQQTLDSLTRYGFNKVRMLVFPKHYSGSYAAVDISYEPPCYPFEGEPRAFDFTRPNPAYFAALEKRIDQMRQRNIIADVILFHPYDAGQWDLDLGMSEDDALIYLRYIIARLAGYRNVWWSLANEYNVSPGRPGIPGRYGNDRRHWDVIGEYIHAHDPSGHPISCHNINYCDIYPDRPWMSHVSYQLTDTYTLMLELQKEYRKPVINDEYQYEGNLPDDWGNLTPELALERHWRSVMACGYATHGECFIRDGNRKDIFWSYGGTITGEAAPRLRFMKDIVATIPYETMHRDPMNTDGTDYYAICNDDRSEYLLLFRRAVPPKKLYVTGWIGGGRPVRTYHAKFYDAWNCKLLEEYDMPSNTRIPFDRDWVVIHLKLVD